MQNQSHFKMPEWAHSATVYEVNLRQYTREGTINAFRPEMKRLKDMGVKVLWFMPITPIAQKNKKGELGSYYAARDYVSVSQEFGTLEDFKALVKEAHELGMKVIIDWVANHTGWDHVWTEEHPDWYLIDTATGDFKIASGMDDIIELDFSDTSLRRAMIDAMKFWVKECDIDGFRVDLAFWVELDFWKEARQELEQTKHLFWLGELDPLDNPEYMGTFDAGYTWTWMHKARDFYQHHLPISSLDSVLQRYASLGDSTARTWFTANHDENSWNGTEYEKYGDMALPLAVFTCTWNGIPLIYSGQELPNRKRLKFFEKDPIEWNGQYALHNFYKILLTLHGSHPALRAADPAVQTQRISSSDEDKVFSFIRKNGAKEVLVVLNFSNQPVNVQLQSSLPNGQYRDVFTNKIIDLTPESRYELPAWGYRVWEK